MSVDLRFDIGKDIIDISTELTDKESKYIKEFIISRANLLNHSQKEKILIMIIDINDNALKKDVTTGAYLDFSKYSNKTIIEIYNYVKTLVK